METRPHQYLIQVGDDGTWKNTGSPEALAAAVSDYLKRFGQCTTLVLDYTGNNIIEDLRGYR